MVIKLLIQVITIKNISKKRLNNLNKELQFLEKFIKNTKKLNYKMIIHKFEGCKNYNGRSDNNICVIKDLFNNHKTCIKIILKNNYDICLVLEDDVKFIRKNFKKNFFKIIDWINENKKNDWDIFFGGCQPIMIFNHSPKKIVRVSAVLAHCMFLSRKFCKKFIKIDYYRDIYKPLSPINYIYNLFYIPLSCLLKPLPEDIRIGDIYICILSILNYYKCYYIKDMIAIQLDRKYILKKKPFVLVDIILLFCIFIFILTSTIIWANV